MKIKYKNYVALKKLEKYSNCIFPAGKTLLKKIILIS